MPPAQSARRNARKRGVSSLTGLSDQALQVAVVLTKRKSNVKHVVHRDLRPFDRFVSNRWRDYLDLRGQGHRDQTGILAVRTRHPNQGLVVGLGHHLEATIGQALPAVRALKAARLAAKDIQNVHSSFVPGNRGV